MESWDWIFHWVEAKYNFNEELEQADSDNVEKDLFEP